MPPSRHQRRNRVRCDARCVNALLLLTLCRLVLLLSRSRLGVMRGGGVGDTDPVGARAAASPTTSTPAFSPRTKLQTMGRRIAMLTGLGRKSSQANPPPPTLTAKERALKSLGGWKGVGPSVNSSTGSPVSHSWLAPVPKPRSPFTKGGTNS